MLQDTDLYQVEELTQRIKDAIATLPESYRESFFVMHRFRDMSYKEIAEILGISPKTVDYRIQQALKATTRRFKGLSAIITTDSISLKPTIYFLIYYYLSIKVLIDNFRCIRGKLAFPYCQTSFLATRKL